MKKIGKMKKWVLVLSALFLVISLLGCQSALVETPDETADQSVYNTSIAAIEASVEKNHDYSTKKEVAEYIKLFHELPPNYITKNEAEKLGWDNSKGNLWDVADQKSIGGDRFGNREGLLPKADGRNYYECDIDYSGGYRGAKRIVYSSDGLIFYTEDHYKTFEKLY